MTKFVSDGTSWKEVRSPGYHLNVDGSAAMKQVDKAWVSDGTSWRLYYTKAVPVVLTAASTHWYRVVVNWNSIAEGGTYVLKRDGATIYSGSATTWVDIVGLLPATTYTYTIEASLGGVVQSTDSEPATTRVYSDPGLAASSPAWHCIDISWTDSDQGQVDYYEVYYGSTCLWSNYASAGKGFRHNNLLPSTSYSYRLDCYRLSPDTLIKQDTVSRTTAGRTLSLSGWPPAYHYAHLDWSDSDQGTLERYHLWVDGGGYAWVDVNARAYDVGGLGASSYHTYQIQGHRNDYGMIAPISNVVGITQPVRPTVTTWAYGSTSPDDNSDGWTRSTARTLTGNNIQYVGGENHLQHITFRTAGYDSNGRFEPFINGASTANDYVRGAGFGVWNDFGGVGGGSDPSNCIWGGGVYSTQLRVGGSGGTAHDGCQGGRDNLGGISDWGSAWWAAWSGQRWDYYVCTYGVYYWYYSALRELEAMEIQYDWMTPALVKKLANEPLHMLTWCEPDTGEITKVQLGSKETEDLYLDWTKLGHPTMRTSNKLHPDWGEYINRRREGRADDPPPDDPNDW